jgi:hypothetical protein
MMAMLVKGSRQRDHNEEKAELKEKQQEETTKK